MSQNLSSLVSIKLRELTYDLSSVSSIWSRLRPPCSSRISLYNTRGCVQPHLYKMRSHLSPVPLCLVARLPPLQPRPLLAAILLAQHYHRPPVRYYLLTFIPCKQASKFLQQTRARAYPSPEMYFVDIYRKSLCYVIGFAASNPMSLHNTPLPCTSCF